MKASRDAFVVAIGIFDGVHLGHRAILRSAVNEAKRRGCRTAALTFPKHPSRVLTPERPIELLQTFDERVESIRRCGVDTIFALPFTRALAKLTPAGFVSDVLLKQGKINAVVVGENFRFGVRRSGGVRDLAGLLAPSGVRVIGVAGVRIGARLVQSTAIRKAIAAGDIRSAARMLGRPMEWSGRMQSGSGLGRRLGARTINLSLANEHLPRLGVYAGWVRKILSRGRAGRPRPAVMNLGAAPTVHVSRRILLEAHILDGGRVSGRAGDRWLARLEFFLRPEKKFKSIPALRRAIKRDIARSRRILKVRVATELDA